MTTYEVIEHIDLPSGASSSITFSNIPSDYEDLIIKASLRSTASADVSQLRLSFNGSTSSFTKNFIQGDGNGGVNAYGGTDSQCGYISAGSATSSTFGNVFIHIVKYTASENKSFTAQVVSENSGATAFQVSHSGYWASTAAINSIGLSASSANLSQYSSATLYGVRKYATSISSPKATGGIISFDSLNNNWVHAFTASGTFTPTEDLSGVEYLVIAGGAGGASGVYSGGSGAGGYRSSVVGESSGGGASAESTLSLAASSNYTVIVGAGGAASPGVNNTSGYNAGVNGSNSGFDAITSIGGGGGAPYDTGGVDGNGKDGGSGGAGSGDDFITYSGGSGTAGQGFDGGSGEGGSPYRGGGGGGAGQAGFSGNNGGAGGDGIASSITGTSVFRAGGGARGYANSSTASGGAGGGGDTESPGAINTGGGAGGGTGGNIQNKTSYAGGSGIVIVRYAA